MKEKKNKWEEGGAMFTAVTQLDAANPTVNLAQRTTAQSAQNTHTHPSPKRFWHSRKD